MPGHALKGRQTAHDAPSAFSLEDSPQLRANTACSSSVPQLRRADDAEHSRQGRVDYDRRDAVGQAESVFSDVAAFI
jgi:hypothetical protein